MATIKKAYQPIMTILAANIGETLTQELYDEVEALTAAKQGGGGGAATTFHRNDAGDVVAVRCFYHGLWMSPQVEEFGKKASSASGLNSMCKAGVSKWTKQQSQFKKAKEELLEQVAAGEVAPAEINDRLAELDEARQAVEPLESGYGFDSLEDCLADNEARGL